MRIRAYQPGDGQRVSEMLSRHTHYQRDAAFWLWINRIWPEAPSVVAVAEDDGHIVGHYAILPLSLQLDHKVVRGGLGIHAFVAPDSRGTVPIFQISKKCYALAKETGIQLIWGFPNENYRLIQEKVEGWQRIDLFDALEKTPGAPASSSLELRRVDTDNSDQLLRLNDFLETSALGSRFGVRPTLRAWTNRYAHHPQNEYEYYLAYDEQAPVAAWVTKIHHDSDSGEKVGHVLDLATPGPTFYRQIVVSLEEHFASRVSRLCFWPFNLEFRHCLESAGFKPTGFSTFFGVKLLDPSLKPMLPELTQSAHWSLAMGMSDVF